MTTMTYEQYWNSVLGERSADEVVGEFGLVEAGPGLDEWLGAAEAETASQARGSLTLDAMAPHHGRALAELAAAISAPVSP